MAFLKFLKAQLGAAVLSGASLGMLLAVTLLIVGEVSGELSFDIELSRGDALWFLLLTPLLLALLSLIGAPLAFLLRWLLRRVRRGSRD